MELALSLGDPSKPFSFLQKKQQTTNPSPLPSNFGSSCMGLALDLGLRKSGNRDENEDDDDDDDDEEDEDEDRDKHRTSSSSSDHHPVQLELLPFSPVPRPNPTSSSQIRFPWLPPSEQHLSCEAGSSRLPAARATSAEEQSSPNCAGSSFMDFSLYRRGGTGSGFVGSKRFCSERGAEAAGIGSGMLEAEPAPERTASRGSDDDENGSTRKKLRLSKEQSAFLEESFKEHHTLNPKQKLALAKQLNLRPRQVEVWFQNRRARTKLKQTEVDCEYLKRCCETLTEENRRLQKELQELRALKSQQPFYMQLPATTLTMCPSCERVAPTAPPPGKSIGNSSSTSAAVSSAATTPTTTNPVAKPIFPFGSPQAQSLAQSQAHRVVSS